MARRFTLRKNGQMMTTFRVPISLTQEQIDDLIARSGKVYGEPEKIEDILYSRMMSGLESWWLDRLLDPDKEEDNDD